MNAEQGYNISKFNYARLKKISPKPIPSDGPQSFRRLLSNIGQNLKSSNHIFIPGNQSSTFQNIGLDPKILKIGQKLAVLGHFCPWNSASQVISPISRDKNAIKQPIFVRFSKCLGLKPKGQLETFTLVTKNSKNYLEK